MLLSRYLDNTTLSLQPDDDWSDKIPLLRSQSPVPPMCWTYPRWRWEYCCHKAGPVMTTVTLSVTPPSWHDRVWPCPVITAATHIKAYYNNAALLHLGILLERGIERQTYIRSLPEELHLPWVGVTFSNFRHLSWAYFLCKRAKILICWFLTLLQ